MMETLFFFCSDQVLKEKLKNSYQWGFYCWKKTTSVNSNRDNVRQLPSIFFIIIWENIVRTGESWRTGTDEDIDDRHLSLPHLQAPRIHLLQLVLIKEDNQVSRRDTEPYEKVNDT